MSYSTIIYDKKQNISVITLNRPAADNAINQQLAQEMADVCREANDDEVRVVVLTGAGDVFCGGSELAVPSGIASAIVMHIPDELSVVSVWRRTKDGTLIISVFSWTIYRLIVIFIMSIMPCWSVWGRTSAADIPSASSAV